jgi:exosome complex RNA-binding protein Rrp42 (RNase PH superfamily)
LFIGELSLNQLQHISIAITAAFKNLRFPQVVVTQDQVSGNIEVDLLENVVDEQGSDKLVKLNTKSCPLLILAGISADNIIFDPNDEESLCMQSSLLIASNSSGEIIG